MKPDWKDAPLWANYLAMDSDGVWYWFGGKPTDGGYLSWVTGGKCTSAQLHYEGWKETLEQRPAP